MIVRILVWGVNSKFKVNFTLYPSSICLFSAQKYFKFNGLIYTRNHKPAAGPVDRN
jgi:hypothetical protein